MAHGTLIIVGPGGVGKSPLDTLVPPDVLRLDPYRLRNAGPRDRDDCLYAPPALRQQLVGALNVLGDNVVSAKASDAQECIEWYPRSGVLFITVRGEWQCAFIPSDGTPLAKIEIYAPVLPTLMAIEEFTRLLGTVKILVLNPASESLLSMRSWVQVEDRTKINCEKRGDSIESVDKRVKSVPGEAPYWKELIEKHGAVEAIDWPFPEFIQTGCQDPGACSEDDLSIKRILTQ